MDQNQVVEDGEIVEEINPIYDEISENEIEIEEIDSEEDLEKMKQRINELELRNLELEKIADISRTYDLDYGKDYVTISDEYDDIDAGNFLNSKKTSVNDTSTKKRHSDHRSTRKKWQRSPSPILQQSSGYRRRSPDHHMMHCDRVMMEKKRRRSASPNFRRTRIVISQKAQPQPQQLQHYHENITVKHHTKRHSDRRKVDKHAHKSSHRLSSDEKLQKRKKSKHSQPPIVQRMSMSSESDVDESEIERRRKLDAQLDAALKRGKKSSQSKNVLKNKLQNIMMSKKQATEKLMASYKVEQPIESQPIIEEDDEELKLRLLALKSKQEVKEIIVEDELTKIKVEPKKDEISAEEQELRLIALKSAILKKHVARKLRKENEQPYSPTDDVVCPVFSRSLPGIVNDAVSQPLKVDIDCNMEISPLVSPAVPADIKPIDMDLSIDMDLVLSNSPTNCNETDFIATTAKTSFYFNGPWLVPVPLIPMDQPFFDPLGVVPPAAVHPPLVEKQRTTSFNDTDVQDLADLLNVDLQGSPKPNPISLETLPTESTTKDCTNSKEKPVPKIVDEEEELRTMLLSSVRKKPEPVMAVPEDAKLRESISDVSVEAECLRSLLLSSLSSQKKTTIEKAIEPPEEVKKPPEINLKEVAERWKKTKEKADEKASSVQNEDLRKALEKLKQTKVNVVVPPQPEITVQKKIEKNVPTVTKAPVIVDEILKVTSPVPAAMPKENVKKAQPLQSIPKLINKSVVSTCVEQNKSKTPAAKRKIAKVLPRTTTEVVKKAKTDAVIAPILKKAAPTATVKRLSPAKKAKPVLRPTSASTFFKTSVVPNNKITNLDKIIRPVPKMIIHLGTLSDSDSAYDDDVDDAIVTAFRDLDNQSPSHIMIGSPKPFNGASSTSQEVAVATTEKSTSDNKTKSSFDKKLEEFLKNVRSKVEQISNFETHRGKATSKASDAVRSTQKLPATPTAVRHLPQSSQLEYKRLIQRMNHLEKQKENRQKPKPAVIVAKRPQTPEKIPVSQTPCENLTITITNEESIAPIPKGLQIILNNSGRQVKEQDVNEKNVSDNIVSSNPPKLKDTLRKQILMKNTISKSEEAGQTNCVEQLVPAVSIEKAPSSMPVSCVLTPSVDSTITTTAPDLTNVQESTATATAETSDKDRVPKASAKPAQTKTIAERIMALNESDRLKFLSKYESNYQENSELFLNDLDKIIGTITEAQIQRQKQFQLENEVDELRAKLKLLEHQLDKQKKSIAKIFPSISESHKNILESRTKCTQLNTVCFKVGKIIQGPNYQLPNDKNKSIGERLKDLAIETRRLKSMNRNSSKQPEHEENDDEDDDQIEVIEIPVKIIEIPDSPVRAHEGDEVKQRVEAGQLSPNTTLLDQIDMKSECSDDGQSLDDWRGIIGLEQKTSTVLVSKKYQSPLDFFNRKGSSNTNFNPDNVLCPFQMNGQCEDTSCTFQHFSS